jgi:regulator of protease activity HflC (stomatin/prohibitin superfamily)
MQLTTQMTEAEREAALLAQAQRLLAEEQDKSTEAQRAQGAFEPTGRGIAPSWGNCRRLLDDSTRNARRHPRFRCNRSAPI